MPALPITRATVTGRTVRAPRRLGGMAAAALLLIAAGCALPPPSPAAAPGAFVEPPAGTVTRFSRSGTGSLAGGPTDFEWTHGRQRWEGREVYAAVSPQLGSQLHDPTAYTLLATLAPDGAPRFRYDPPVGYRFPLEVGQTWNASTTLSAPGRPALPLALRFEVQAQEEVVVPAGRFPTYRVRIQNSLGEMETVWTAPALGLGVVRRTVERPPTHPAGAGRLETVLVARTLPTAR
ncbi:MAG: hypothetical protein ABIX12_11385 [Rubrivivax sp.]